MLDEFSEVVARAGHPETRYRVWKVTGEQAGDHAYLFGSAWVDRDVYDAVHAHDVLVHHALAKAFRDQVHELLTT